MEQTSKNQFISMRIHLTTIRGMIRSDNKRSCVLFQNGVINGGTVEVIDKSFNSPRNGSTHRPMV